MKFLLDTCFISELRKPIPMQSVLNWFDQADESHLFISSLSIGELSYGIARLPDGNRKKEIANWLLSIESSFVDQIIPIDVQVARRWGEMRADAQIIGRQLNVIDGLLAATCDVYGLALVTRNIKDFETTGIRILNPWSL